MKYNVEYTDTFGGEANYCWVRREAIEVPENAKRSLIMRKAKAAMRLTGMRGVVTDMGDVIAFKPYKCCTVMFVTAEY
jgi:hypothetical protein